ncbi:hypothetical protein NAP1_11578 [Erythrobacter sp. NAP1]|uniref:hypothetical protein n=1 Tax=Erythrobacter sp. NAP1 TaxID=237727 RepID=UPI00006876A6|nr:hypothetical protein [Erythrobacter sp. NAP1]EAQ28233.1 hypothetical protein NAP1_11578 [Erythrobacter sp. NAP1]
MIAGFIWRAALLAVAVLAIGLQLDRQTRRTPELSPSVPELVRSSAQKGVAAFAVAGDDADYALQEAERLVRRRPLPAEHLRILAQAQFNAGRLSDSALTIQYAAQRGWREPLAQESMLRLALQAGDEAEAARRFVALFVRRDTADSLLEELGSQVLAEPGGVGRETFASILDGAERWHSQFFTRGVRVLSIDAFAEILVASIENGTDFDCSNLRTAIERVEPRDAAAAGRIKTAIDRQC